MYPVPFRVVLDANVLFPFIIAILLVACGDGEEHASPLTCSLVDAELFFAQPPRDCGDLDLHDSPPAALSEGEACVEAAIASGQAFVYRRRAFNVDFEQGFAVLRSQAHPGVFILDWHSVQEERYGPLSIRPCQGFAWTEDRGYRCDASDHLRLCDEQGPVFDVSEETAAQLLHDLAPER